MREEKQLLLDEIKEKVKLSKSLIVTRYENITSSQACALREALVKSSADMEVVKKRIFLKVLEECGYSYKLEDLEGHIAVILIDGDPINPTKIIFDFGKETNKIEVIRGEIEGKSYSKEDMLILSKLPTLTELRSQFLGLLEAPMSQTLSVMDNVLTSVIFALEEKKKLRRKK